MKVFSWQLSCQSLATLRSYVTGLRYAVTLQVRVRLVTPYRVTHLQRYEVTLHGNVTSVYPPLWIVLYHQL